MILKAKLRQLLDIIPSVGYHCAVFIIVLTGTLTRHIQYRNLGMYFTCYIHGSCCLTARFYIVMEYFPLIKIQYYIVRRLILFLPY